MYIDRTHFGVSDSVAEMSVKLWGSYSWFMVAMGCMMRAPATARVLGSSVVTTLPITTTYLSRPNPLAFRIKAFDSGSLSQNAVEPDISNSTRCMYGCIL